MDSAGLKLLRFRCILALTSHSATLFLRFPQCPPVSVVDFMKRDIHHKTRTARRECAALRDEDNFTNVLSRLDIAVGFTDLIEWENVIDMRSNPGFIYPAQYLAHPVRDLVAFTPQVSEIQSEHTFISAHQTKRIESRSLHYRFQGAQLSANSGSRSCGQAKDSHASSRTQRAITLFPA